MAIIFFNICYWIFQYVCQINYFCLKFTLFNCSDMKRALLFLALLCSVTGLFAKPVDVSTATKAAARFRQAPLLYSSQAGTVRMPLRSTAPLTLTDDSYSAFYVFSNPDGNGFVLIAKDDRISPVIAYSNANPWITQDMPDQLREWLEGYCTQMSNLSDTQSPEIAEEWQSLLSGSYQMDAPSTPLIETHWGQAPYYNALCPTNEKDGRAVTGCVATAFAQILRYWKYPEHGWGFHAYTDKRYGYLSSDFSQHFYDWGNMPEHLDENSTPEEVNAVALLMSDCGIAVDMGYGPRGSGASTPLIATRIVRYFGYKPSAELVERDKFANDTEWLSVIRNEIDNKRVMIYRGTGSRGGHCFVCDGYDSSSRIHINWGWKGQCDGYFSVKAMNPVRNETTIYDFTQEQMAIIHIEPDSSRIADITDVTYAAKWTSNPAEIRYGQPFSINTTLLNEGKEVTCDLVAALFDEDGDFVNVWTEKQNITIPKHQQLNVSIDTLSKMNLLPGKYELSLFLAMADSTLIFIDTDNEDYSAIAKFEIKHWDEVEMNGEITITDGMYFAKGKEAEISVDISYVGQAPGEYTGAYQWVLFPMDCGNPCDTVAVGTITGWSGPDSTLTARVTPKVDAGTYRLTLMLVQDNEQRPAGSRYYPNPTKIIVQDTIAIDPYEPNDTPELATPVAVTFGESDTVTVTVMDASIHRYQDIDYYVLQIPKTPDYEYEESAEIVATEHPYFMETYVSVYNENGKWIVVPEVEGATGYYAVRFTVVRKRSSAVPQTMSSQTGEQSAVKRIVNGQIVIENDGRHYNAAGVFTY